MPLSRFSLHEQVEDARQRRLLRLLLLQLRLQHLRRISGRNDGLREVNMGSRR